MLAIDTNIIVRLLIRDDEGQARSAHLRLAGEPLFVSRTVLLETAWVLQKAGGFKRQEVVAALTAFVDLPNVTLEMPDEVLGALEWAEGGMDLADALHLASAGECEAFISFDRKLAQVATRLGAKTVRAPEA